MQLFSWFLAAIGIIGVYIAGENRWGWAIGSVYQVLWIVYAYFTEQYPFIIVCLVYLGVYVRNFYGWGFKKEPDESRTVG